MLMDGISLVEGSQATNLVIDSGASFPANPNVAEVFYKTTAPVGFHVYTGSAWLLVNTGSQTSIYDIGLTVEQKPTASATLLVFTAARAFTLPSGFTGSAARSGTAAAASSVFTINRNASSIGTITFAPTATTGTFTGAGAAFSVGDILTIIAPSSQDATLADIGITLVTQL